MPYCQYSARMSSGREHLLQLGTQSSLIHGYLQETCCQVIEGHKNKYYLVRDQRCYSEDSLYIEFVSNEPLTTYPALIWITIRPFVLYRIRVHIGNNTDSTSILERTVQILV